MFYVTGTTAAGHLISEDRVFITEKEALTAVNSAIEFGIIIYADIHNIDTGEVVASVGEK